MVKHDYLHWKPFLNNAVSTTATLLQWHLRSTPAKHLLILSKGLHHNKLNFTNLVFFSICLNNPANNFEKLAWKRHSNLEGALVNCILHHQFRYKFKSLCTMLLSCLKNGIPPLKIQFNIKFWKLKASLDPWGNSGMHARFVTES